MKTLLLALLAAVLWMEPGAACAAEGSETAAEAPAWPDEPPQDRQAEERDEDDLVEIRGLVFEFFVADDSEQTQLGIEATDRDYLVAPGNSARALAQQIGKTVKARAWLVPDDAGDIWLELYAFEVTD